MILRDFLVKDKLGYYCKYGDFYIDPMQPVKHAVVSHGHGDHASPGHANIYATAPTIAFMKFRFSKVHLHEFKEKQSYAAFQLGDVELMFIPAGHILGSVQILMTHKGVRYLYTGDYKLQADTTCEPIAFVQADVLITESTFADPTVAHPDPEVEIAKLNSVNGNIMLGAYSLGKAQRLTAMINQFCTNKQILVHHGILGLHKIYESFGIALGAYLPYHRKAMKDSQSQNNIYLVPPMTFRSYRRAINVVKVFASGWSHLQQQHQFSLFISDHVDWNDILMYIDQVQPREIWTVHGDGRLLQQYFEESIPVRHIDSHQTA